MLQLLLTTMALLLCLVIERGFIGSLPAPWSLLPLCAAIGVYVIVHMRPVLGLVWLAAAGFALDVHQGSGMGQVVVLCTLGVLLLLVVNQYVTHRSTYALTILSASFFLTWSVTNAFLALLRSATADVALLTWTGVWTVLLGVFSVMVASAISRMWRRLVLPRMRVRL